MMKNKDSKSLTEVWEWKEKVYNKIIKNKDNPNYSENDTDDLIKRLGLEKISMIKK
jgi:hypothetical protein